MNPIQMIEHLREIREALFEIYKTLPDERIAELEEEDPTKDEERKEFYLEFKKTIKPLKEEIRKNIFILLCMGYYTDTIEDEEIYDNIKFTMEEIEEMYQQPFYHSNPLMRTFGFTSNPVSSSFPHPRNITLNPSRKGFLNPSMLRVEKTEEEKKYERKMSLIQSRVYLNIFVDLYLKFWNIGIDVKEGDIQIIEPPESKYKLFFEICKLLSKMNNIKYKVKDNSPLFMEDE